MTKEEKLKALKMALKELKNMDGLGFVCNEVEFAAIKITRNNNFCLREDFPEFTEWISERKKVFNKKTYMGRSWDLPGICAEHHVKYSLENVMKLKVRELKKFIKEFKNSHE